MLTDIFAYRYAGVPLWQTFGEPERRLLVQGFRILTEHICPYWYEGQEYAYGKNFWTDLHKRLSMELGLPSLSPLTYAYNMEWMGKPHTTTGTWTMDKVCENWVLRQFDRSEGADRFVKDRLSLVEIGFRKRGEDVAAENALLPRQIAENRLRASRKGAGIRLPGDPAAWLITKNEQTNKVFRDAVEELNTRFRQSGCDLNYHNGFIQRSTDAVSAQEVEAPFWALVAEPQWKNVDLDMKEALDQRDAGARDPAFYAARALESTIKIISDSKGWTHSAVGLWVTANHSNRRRSLKRRNCGLSTGPCGPRR